MTQRERLLAALRGGIPDRVPVCLAGTNRFIGAEAERSGRTYHEVETDPQKPAWQVDVDYSRHLGTAVRLCADALIPPPENAFAADTVTAAATRIVERHESSWLVERRWETPLGPLIQRVREFMHKGSVIEKYPVDDPEKDLIKLGSPFSADVSEWQLAPSYLQRRRYLQEDGILGVPVVAPITKYFKIRQPEFGILDLMDQPSALLDYFEQYADFALRLLRETFTRVEVDYVHIGGSTSSMSLVSPDLYRNYNLPFVQNVTALCKSYDIPTRLHMCGRCGGALDMLAFETDLNAIDPLERPPGGDVDLATVKARYGRQLCLSGNVNTFLTLARGTPAEVKQEVRECLDAAAENGGYILGTGDSVTLDTPMENLAAIAEAGHCYGAY